MAEYGTSLLTSSERYTYSALLKQQTLPKSTDSGNKVKCSIYGGGWVRDLQYQYNDIVSVIVSDAKKSDQNRGVVDLWRWSVREVLVHVLKE